MSDALRIFPDDFVLNVEASDAYKRWARTSPGDKARWESFRDALLADSSAAAVPVMSTKFGKALVAAGREHMSISSLVGQMQNPYPPPDPPPGPPPPTPPPSTITVTAPANLATVQASNPAGSIVALSGNFGNQTFTQTKAITFRPLSPGSATLGNVSFNAGAGSITLEDLTVGTVILGYNLVSLGGVFPPPVTDIVLRRIDGARFQIHHAQRTRIYGGDWGLPTLQQSENRIASVNPYDGANVPYDTLIDGAYIHNFGMTTSSPHSEGIQCWAANGLVIRNCTFQYCGGTGSITIQAVGEPETPLSALGMTNTTYFAHAANFLIHDNVSLDTVKGTWQTNPYYAYYDLQGEVGLPGCDWAATRASNTFPRGQYIYGAGGTPASDTGPSQRSYALPNPAPPPNWPPA